MSIDYDALKSVTLNGYCFADLTPDWAWEQKDPWINIDQKIRETVRSKDLVYPGPSLAGMPLSKMWL